MESPTKTPDAPKPMNPWGTPLQAAMSSAWGNASSPWKPVTSNIPCSLEDVMSEELAKKLEEEEQSANMTTSKPRYTIRILNCKNY